jgi:hypothetical protein
LQKIPHFNFSKKKKKIDQAELEHVSWFKFQTDLKTFLSFCGMHFADSLLANSQPQLKLFKNFDFVITLKILGERFPEDSN